MIRKVMAMAIRKPTSGAIGAPSGHERGLPRPQHRHGASALHGLAEPLRGHVVYADGSCEPNPGEAGWAAVVSHDDKVSALTGHEAFTTNNPQPTGGAAWK